MGEEEQERRYTPVAPGMGRVRARVCKGRFRGLNPEVWKRNLLKPRTAGPAPPPPPPLFWLPQRAARCKEWSTLRHALGPPCLWLHLLSSLYLYLLSFARLYNISSLSLSRARDSCCCGCL